MTTLPLLSSDLVQRHIEQGELIAQKDLCFKAILGSGASGVTYGAVYQGEEVAVKIYSKSILKEDTISVQNELRIMARMEHENVVKFRGVCLQADPPGAALVTLLARRGELGKALQKDRGLKRGGIAARFSIVLGLARGLQYLHAQGVIHRDVKPSNVLLDENYNPQISDFGFSRYFNPSGTMTGETGSYRYMAPEVVRHGKYGAKADVYSFAVVVNEIFTGQVAHEFVLPLDVAIGVAMHGVRPCQKRLKNARLRDVIARAWDAEPDLRPEWDEIIEELGQAQAEMAEEGERWSVFGGVRRRKAGGGEAGQNRGNPMRFASFGRTGEGGRESGRNPMRFASFGRSGEEGRNPMRFASFGRRGGEDDGQPPPMRFATFGRSGDGSPMRFASMRRAPRTSGEEAPQVKRFPSLWRRARA